MKPEKMNSLKTNFLQRRYGVSLGRRYVLAAASIMLLGVVGCSSVDNSNNALIKSDLPSAEQSF
jgi:hypothetical protein